MKTGSIALAAAMLFAGAAAAAPAAQPSPALAERIRAKLAEAGPGTRFGLVVATEDGRELIALSPEGRFVPASNTKIFTTVAAFDALPGIDGTDETAGATVRLEPTDGKAPDVVLGGHGDARLSSAADCVADCLAALADAVAAKTRAVRHVVGDDSLFPDQRWSAGMSWNNMATRSGTAVSALTLDDDELTLRVVPTAPGRAPRLELLPYYRIDNRAVTVAGGPTDLDVDRLPGTDVVRLSGTVAAGSDPAVLRLGVDDAAHYAAWRLKALLEARGVSVGGDVMVRHRPVRPADDPAVRNGAPPARPPRPEALARLSPPPLLDGIAIINKASQNVHAELLLRRLGRLEGTGSVEDGLAAVHRTLARAGVPRAAYDLSDGSGMSTYNRVAPRAMVGLLRWVSAQPWGAAWRATLPVAGVDGTLARRFRGTGLEGRLFAKTGTLNAANALAGYMVAGSGRTLVFAAYANDAPGGESASVWIDAALGMIAAEN